MDKKLLIKRSGLNGFVSVTDWDDDGCYLDLGIKNKDQCPDRVYQTFDSYDEFKEWLEELDRQAKEVYRKKEEKRKEVS